MYTGQPILKLAMTLFRTPGFSITIILMGHITTVIVTSLGDITKCRSTTERPIAVGEADIILKVY